MDNLAVIGMVRPIGTRLTHEFKVALKPNRVRNWVGSLIEEPL
jgi:hypothetical protein